GLAVSAATLHTVTLTTTPAPGAAKVEKTAYEQRTLRAVPAVASAQPEHIRTAAKTVGELLDDEGITLTAANRVSPETSTPLTDGLAVRVSTLPTVDVTVGGQVTKQVIAEAPTVGEMLAKQGIDVGDHDVVTPEVSTDL